MAKNNTFNESVILSEADAVSMMQQRMKGVQNSVTDFDTNNLIKKYVAKGGYDFSIGLDNNVQLLIQSISLMKAKGKI